MGVLLAPELRAALERGARHVGVTLDEPVVELLGRYLDLLVVWNRKINLTAVRDAADIVTRHFVDSLAVAPFLPTAAATLVDVGSGAGFPGAVLAAARPGLAVPLVESSHKKAAFLRTIRRELPLSALTVLTERAEALPGQAGFQPFDVAVSRATWGLLDWLPIGVSLVRRPGGLVIGMEGAERHALPAGARRIEYSLDGARRALVLLNT